MTSITEDPPWAVIVLVAGDRRRVLAPVERATPCDLDLVHRLLWLHVRAKRMGWRLQLADVDGELRDLLDFVGVASSLLPPKAS